MSELAVYRPPTDETLAMNITTYAAILKFGPQLGTMSHLQAARIRTVWVNLMAGAGVEDQDIEPAFREWATRESAFPAPSDIIKIALWIAADRRERLRPYPEVLPELEPDADRPKARDLIAERLGVPAEDVTILDLQAFLHERIADIELKKRRLQ